MDNRPQGRQQHITGQAKGVYKRGSGLGTGPVGNKDGYAHRGEPAMPQSARSGGFSQKQTRASGRKSPLLLLILAAVVIFGGGGVGLSSLLGGGSSADPYAGSAYTDSAYSSSSYGGSAVSSLGSLVDPFVNMSSSNVSSGWSGTPNTSKLDTSVVSGARAKRTVLLGNGRDEVTILVYMCGADLESQSGMATADLQEMLSAKLSRNVNILVYTGGATAWKNNVVSSRTNQIYKVENGNLRCLEKDLGSAAMTDPATLTSFIKYGTKNYPANRTELILWDHGGGSISGYGYDEKFARSGSMDLNGIDRALKNAGATFDFIGFDACLMATVENALMLTPYADYLIASEETEPGVGWYYTNWLTALSADTSMPTVQIGRNIADDFVSVCAQKCAGQKTTLSVIDLAELEKTIPDTLKGFAASTLELLGNDEYKTVSDARGSAREFAASSKIDQVDLVSLSNRLGTAEAKELAQDILGAVKYNRTSSNMTDAYGLSIYFPYRKMSSVDSAVKAYESIGMDESYAEVIQKFAGMEISGQAASGGSASPLYSLLGSSFSSGSAYSSSSSAMDSDAIVQILSGLLSGGTGNVQGLTGLNSLFLGRSLDADYAAGYIAANSFDASALQWTTGSDGAKVMYLPEEQWELVQELEKNVFVDDGEGFIDLGLDNLFDFTEDGGLIGTPGETWLAIDGQPVAYYYMDTVQDGDAYTITGRVPALLNGVRVDLILVFDTENPYGFIAGAQTVYPEDVTAVAAKSLTGLQEGDVIDFLCDYYSYDGAYQDSYYLGDSYTVHGTPEISDVRLTGYKVSTAYRFTDIYRQNYWTPTVE